MNGWIGVDLDGTLAAHKVGHFKADFIGEPIMPMVERVRRWLSEGRTVKIFTARVSGGHLSPERQRDVDESRNAINKFCERNFGQVLEITCEKDYGMIELWDDRAVQVEMNTGRVVGFSPRGLA